VIPVDRPLPRAVGDETEDIRDELRTNLATAKHTTVMSRTSAAERQWEDEIYDELTPDDELGPMPALVARAKAHVLRMSMVYALADGAGSIDLPHQAAALALWDYCRASVEFVFDNRPRADRSASGDEDTDRLYAAVKRAGEKGMRRGEIYATFSNHRSAGEVDRMVAILVDLGWATESSCEPESGGRGGRPSKVLHALPAPTKSGRP
jgi:hypothetical protein